MAVSLSQSVLSTQFVQVQVIATSDGSLYDPTADVVQMAFIPQSYPAAQPGPSDWVAAAWETDPGPAYWASALIGPANGGTALAVGSFTIWVRVTDSPAVPALPGPTLSIY